MKPDYSKVFGRAIIVCWAVIISCWVISLFAPELFVIVVENERIINAGAFIETHTWALYLFAVASSTLSMFPYWLACIGKRWFDSRRDVVICVVTILVSVAVKLWNPTVGLVVDLMWINTMLPYSIGKKAKRCFSMLCISFAYQALIIITRSEIFAINVGGNLLSHFMITIDYIVFMVLSYLYFLKLGGASYGIFSLFAVGQIQRRIGIHEGRKACRIGSNRSKTSRAERRVNRQLLWRRFRSYAIVFGCMGVAAFFGYRTLETFILFGAYLALRWTFPKTFHTTPWTCVFLSVILFSTLILNLASIHWSLTSGVIVALLFSYGLFAVQDYIDIKQSDQGRERSFRLMCQSLGLSQTMTDFAVDYKLKGLSIKEQMEITQLGESTVKNYRTRLNKTIK